jgi:hypothetical protein
MEHLSHRVEDAGGGDLHVIELPSEFGGEAAEEFHRLVQTILLQRGAQILVGCRRVDRATEEGIAVLVDAHARVRRVGGRLVLDEPRRLLGRLKPGDDDGLSGTRSPLIPPPTPISGQDKRALPGPGSEEQDP